jgi:hypothetical protein
LSWQLNLQTFLLFQSLVFRKQDGLALESFKDAIFKKRIKSGTDVMIFKIFSPKNLAKILAFFAQTTASFCKNVIITLVFEKTPFFRRKLAKIAENCDHSIDPSASLHRLLAFLSLIFLRGDSNPGLLLFITYYSTAVPHCS